MNCWRNVIVGNVNGSDGDVMVLVWREEEKEEEDTVRVHEGYRKDTVVYIMDIVGYSGRGGGGVKRSGRREKEE